MSKRSVLCVLKTGRFEHPLGNALNFKYTADHVLALQQQVKKHCPGSEFYCLSNEKIPGVNVIPLKHNWPGWWSKMEIFSHDLGPVLYLDLDMVLRNDISYIMEDTHYFTAWHSKRGLNSSIMAWDESKRHIYESFASQCDDVMQAMTRLECLGDQCFIQNSLAKWDKFKDRYPEAIVNYESLKGNDPSDKNHIICFKGRTKPQNANEEWVRSALKNKKKTVLTWYWSQTTGRTSVSGSFHYTADHVNIWADMVKRNVSHDVDIACVTDIPEGIDPAVRIIPVPQAPKIDNPWWKEEDGMPQCYRRLNMYRPDAAELFSTDSILMMDLDCVIAKNIDHLVDTKEDVKFIYSTARHRVMNGSMQFVICGSRPDIWTRFNAKEAVKASRQYVGSDQSWISHVVGKHVPLFTRDDRVMHYKSNTTDVPKDTCVMFFSGRINPWDQDHHKLQWVSDHYRRTPA